VLGVGEEAPEFSGTTASGETLALSALRGRPLILYFFPKAGTPGCTIEANEFARHFPDFRKAGVQVVGISVDSVASQRRFSDECHLPFPLVADSDRTIARRYGVLGLLGLAKRVTFWIGRDGRVEEVIAGTLPGPHVRRALARLVATAPSGVGAERPPGPA
jgi:peroxiredoxin Q/BCP